jgi:hypothetical protein
LCQQKLKISKKTYKNEKCTIYLIPTNTTTTTTTTKPLIPQTQKEKKNLSAHLYRQSKKSSGNSNDTKQSLPYIV